MNLGTVWGKISHDDRKLIFQSLLWFDDHYYELVRDSENNGKLAFVPIEAVKRALGKYLDMMETQLESPSIRNGVKNGRIEMTIKKSIRNTKSLLKIVCKAKPVTRYHK